MVVKHSERYLCGRLLVCATTSLATISGQIDIATHKYYSALSLGEFLCLYLTFEYLNLTSVGYTINAINILLILQAPFALTLSVKPF